MNGFYPEGKLYNTQENKKFMLKSENICIKAEIIKIFDLT